MLKEKSHQLNNNENEKATFYFLEAKDDLSETEVEPPGGYAW